MESWYDDQNAVLLKETWDGRIVDAVSGIDGSFKIDEILVNPVTDEIFLLGQFENYWLIRIDADDHWYTIDTSEYMWNWPESIDFDETGAFYYTTTNSMQHYQLWKYVNGVSTMIAQSNDWIQLHRVLRNGYVVYSADDAVWLRAPTGSLSTWPFYQYTRGVYSSVSDSYYQGGTGFNFDSLATFPANESVDGYMDDWDAADGEAISFGTYSVSVVQFDADRTVDVTNILPDFTVKRRDGVNHFFTKFAAHLAGGYLYFAGKDAAAKQNIFRYDMESGGEPDRLLIGADDNAFNITWACFSDSGEVIASAQRLADGTYGCIRGNWNTMAYTFEVVDVFEQVGDILLR